MEKTTETHKPMTAKTIPTTSSHTIIAEGGYGPAHDNEQGGKGSFRV
jgi:hypothetical protein